MNENEIIEVTESKKGMLGKIAVVAAGVVAGSVGAVLFWRKKKLQKLDDENSDDSQNESIEE